jgi:hypothetical protein
MISGVRKGFEDVRFEPCEEESTTLTAEKLGDN